MFYDGRIWFSTKIDNAQILKDLKKIETDIRKAHERIARAKNEKLPLVTQLENAAKQLDEAEKKLDEYQKHLDSLQSVTIGTDTSDEAYKAAVAKIPAAVADVVKQQEKVDSLKKQWENINKKVEEYDEIIIKASNDIERGKKKAAELSARLNSSGAKMKAAFDKSRASADKFGKRLLEIGKSALVFNLISSGLRSMVEYMNATLKTNSEYTAQLVRLKGALLTAFQPIYEFVLPGLLAVLEVLTDIVGVIANILSVISGKTAAQSAENAEALNEQMKAIENVGDAAEKARMQLMGFDEINKLESTDVSSRGIGGIDTIEPDFSAFDTAKYKAKIDELTACLSGALLAMGAILAFSGVNIPLGIALMAAGSVGLANAAKENWNAIEEKLGGPLGGIVTLLSTFLLPMGAILAFSGVNIPLGIALMAAGLTGIALTNNVSWGAMDREMKKEVTSLMTILGGSLLVIGAILAFSGANIPVGIAMIATGGFALATAASLNWDAILDKCKEAWGKIKQWFSTNVAPKLTKAYWDEKFSAIAEALARKIADGINSASAFLNAFIDRINDAMNFSWGSFSLNGKTIIPAGSLQLFTIPNIPYLAQGAVIPPNREFMAVLGDQKHGTNIEAPEDLIRKIVREETAGLGGSERLAQLLEILIDTVENIEVGDETIGKAAARYNRSTARAKGV